MSDEPSTPIQALVIDDSEEIRNVIRLAFARTADFEVVAEASSGETGVAAAATHHPGLILLDIAMPDMDGLQALPLIRSSCPDSTIVMLSGFSEQDAALSAIENGAHGFIRKGVSVSDLLKQLREITELRSTRRNRAHGR